VGVASSAAAACAGAASNAAAVVRAEEGLRWRGGSGEIVGEFDDLLRGRAGEARKLRRRRTWLASSTGEPGGRPRTPGAAVSAKSASSRGQRRPRASGGSGVRDLQWKARRQGDGGELRGEAGEAWGERKRENGREGAEGRR